MRALLERVEAAFRRHSFGWKSEGAGKWGVVDKVTGHYWDGRTLAPFRRRKIYKSLDGAKKGVRDAVRSVV